MKRMTPTEKLAHDIIHDLALAGDYLRQAKTHCQCEKAKIHIDGAHNSITKAASRAGLDLFTETSRLNSFD